MNVDGRTPEDLKEVSRRCFQHVLPLQRNTTIPGTF
jgi:hypothetical protein